MHVVGPQQFTGQLRALMDAEGGVIGCALPRRCRPVALFVRQEDRKCRSTLRIGPALEPSDVLDELPSTDVRSRLIEKPNVLAFDGPGPPMGLVLELNGCRGSPLEVVTVEVDYGPRIGL